MDQPNLFDFRPTPPSPRPETRAEKTEREFREFHLENPHVYREMVRLCLDLVDRGLLGFGMPMIFETLRYSRMRTTGSEFKLNNSYRRRYADLIKKNEPRLRDVIRTRDPATGEK